jgi:hypothetical protein
LESLKNGSAVATIPASSRSAKTNGRRKFVDGDGRGPWARRWRDLQALYADGLCRCCWCQSYVFDELWGYTSERSHRLWDEMVPPPTRKIACRLTVTYAGFEGESNLLEGLYKRGLGGEQVELDLYRAGGLLMLWSHHFTAPWQTDDWREQMREQLRPNAYLRMIENRWVSSDSTFVEMEWWDACTDADATPLI